MVTLNPEISFVDIFVYSFSLLLGLDKIADNSVCDQMARKE